MRSTRVGSPRCTALCAIAVLQPSGHLSTACRPCCEVPFEVVLIAQIAALQWSPFHCPFVAALEVVERDGEIPGTRQCLAGVAADKPAPICLTVAAILERDVLFSWVEVASAQVVGQT